MTITRIKPREINNDSHGWISPKGVIYAGDEDHADMIVKLVDLKGGSEIAMLDNLPGTGWVRWWSLPDDQTKITRTGLEENERGNGMLMFDWSEYGNADSEAMCRNITKQIEHPFDEVMTDAMIRIHGGVNSWRGTMDDFIKFGTSGRRSFISRLDEALSRLQ